MPRQRVPDVRSDFRGGINTAFSPDTLAINELVDCSNGRGYTQAAINKRNPTQRIHVNALEGGTHPITALFQWGAPSGLQIVAICNGNFYYRSLGDVEFTKYVPYTVTKNGTTTNGTAVITALASTADLIKGMTATGTGLGVGAKIASIDSATQITLSVVSTAGATVAITFTAPTIAMSTTTRAQFDVYRFADLLELYIADGALWRWDGTNLADASAFTSPPPAVDITIYKGRGYATTGINSQLWISDLGDPDTWSDGPSTAAGAATEVDVETFDSEALIKINKVGSSLAMAKADNIARYTGVSNEEIKVDTETEGITSELGTVGIGCFVRLDELLAALSKKGPMVVSESGIQLIQPKTFNIYDSQVNRDAWNLASMQYHGGRKELWCALPMGSSSENNGLQVYDMRAQCWYGPFSFPFHNCVLAQYQRPDGSLSLLSAGYDGRVRDLDVVNAALPNKDDILHDGTGGTNITLSMTLPILHAGQPQRIKTMRQRQILSADLGADGILIAAWSSEFGSGSVSISSGGAGIREYPFMWNTCRGTRISRTFSEATDNPITVIGVKGDSAVSGEAWVPGSFTP